MTFSSHIQIRLASLLDLDVLVNLQIEYEKFFQQLGCDSYEIFPSERRKKLLEFAFCESAPLQILVAEKENTVIRYCTFYKLYIHEVPPLTVYYVTSLYIQKIQRNSVVLYAFFKELIHMAQKQKIQKIMSSFWGDNKPAISIYKRFGVKFSADVDNENF